jgi:hypothetical protein
MSSASPRGASEACSWKGSRGETSCPQRCRVKGGTEECTPQQRLSVNGVFRPWKRRNDRWGEGIGEEGKSGAFGPGLMEEIRWWDGAQGRTAGGATGLVLDSGPSAMGGAGRACDTGMGQMIDGVGSRSRERDGTRGRE